MRRRVVITGFGCVTPLGQDPFDVWDRFAAGHSAAAPITLFDASQFPVRIAAEVTDWNPSQAEPLVGNVEQYGRQSLFAVTSASQAARSACLSGVDPLRLGIYLGCGEVFPQFEPLAQLVAASIQDGPLEMNRFMQGAVENAQALKLATLEPGAPLGCIAAMLDARGPMKNYTTACVSSTLAIGEALEAIRDGDADVILAGGAHSMIHPLGITGFHRLNTLSTRNDEPQRAYRPFERDRDGFVVGEGGAVLVLESLDHARHRGAPIWAELSGYAATHDAFRVTDTRADGAEAARSITLALHDAQCEPGQIDYINAHGSGTPLNDKAETAAIKRALGKHAYSTPVSSTKAMTGHLTTACGAVEVLACLMSLARNILPPTINYETPSPECDLDYVPNAARDVDCRHVLNLNLGFGGNNAALVLSRFTG